MSSYISQVFADGSEIIDKQYWTGYIQRTGSVGRNGPKNANVEKCKRT